MCECTEAEHVSYLFLSGPEHDYFYNRLNEVVPNTAPPLGASVDVKVTEVLEVVDVTIEAIEKSRVPLLAWIAIVPVVTPSSEVFAQLESSAAAQPITSSTDCAKVPVNGQTCGLVPSVLFEGFASTAEHGPAKAATLAPALLL
jgi:hypothetical protein